jgi:hypothetical protein
MGMFRVLGFRFRVFSAAIGMRVLGRARDPRGG